MKERLQSHRRRRISKEGEGGRGVDQIRLVPGSEVKTGAEPQARGKSGGGREGGGVGVEAEAGFQTLESGGGGGRGSGGRGVGYRNDGGGGGRCVIDMGAAGLSYQEK